MKNITIKKSNQKVPVGKIVCVGRNYTEHAKELGNVVPEKPIVFLKPNSSLIFSGDKIVYPSFSNDMHHEVELVLLINETIKDGNLSEAENAIAGYGVGLDMTLRDVQNKLKEQGHPWTIAKGFDTSAVVSDFISKKDYALTLEEQISLSVNGDIKQNEILNKMIFPPAEIVEYLSSLMTLEKGDIIFTGTPKGVGKVKKGDNIFAEISDVAELNCKVE
ncbi:MAG: FAA hydrolase family protein [Ignavibacteriales bacterium CG_4_9_14_3_um_filter_30_11]|nr:MAG: FAA hydrolase family protein [Ignavibacteriales bacterium CG_4_9_14_3_um_filter_30_11]